MEFATSFKACETGELVNRDACSGPRYCLLTYIILLPLDWVLFVFEHRFHGSTPVHQTANHTGKYTLRR